MSGGTFEKLFGAWTAAEADLYEALDQWPSEHCTEWEEKFKLMRAIADERYTALFGARTSVSPTFNVGRGNLGAVPSDRDDRSPGRPEFNDAESLSRATLC